MSATPQRDLTFDQAMESCLLARPQVTFLLVGHGRDDADPLLKHLLKDGMRGVIVEPVPAQFEKLQSLYAGNDRIKVELATLSRQTCGTVIARHGLQRIDLLQFDTDGQDFELLTSFDFRNSRPFIVRYRGRYLNPQDKAAADQLLVLHGYVLMGSADDRFALSGQFASLLSAEPAQIATTAAALLAQGRSGQAHTLYEYLYRLDPQDAAVAQASISAASEAGQHAIALRRMIDLVRRDLPLPDLTPLLQRTGQAAVKAFNRHLAADNLMAAAPIIYELAAINPGKYTFTALNVARSRGDQDRIVEYAEALLQQDATHWLAHGALSDIAGARGDRPGKLRHLTQSLLHRPREVREEGRLFSAEAVYTISEMLIGAPHPEFPSLIRALRAGVAACPEQFDSEKDTLLDRFMRVSLETMDPAILDEPISWDPPPQPALGMADSNGQPIAPGELPGRVRAQAPQAVFLAAADEVYLRRYGRNYLNTILQRCDVNCVVLLCMIGRADRLKDTISAIGVHDPRVFYLVDELDPAYAVTYYKQDEALTNCARAYYQSVRFLLLDHLLHMLDLPLIITDIDLSLQGSLAGLLQRHADASVVLNRNDITVSYGSYFTANLLLVRPEPTGRQLARLLRLLLQRALKHDHIEQCVDQSMLTLAKYCCHQHGLEDFGYFAPDDINNWMFNRTNMDSEIVETARRFVFFAYYGSQGDSAVNLMQAVETAD